MLKIHVAFLNLKMLCLLLILGRSQLLLLEHCFHICPKPHHLSAFHDDHSLLCFSPASPVATSYCDNPIHKSTCPNVSHLLFFKKSFLDLLCPWSYLAVPDIIAKLLDEFAYIFLHFHSSHLFLSSLEFDFYIHWSKETALAKIANDFHMSEPMLSPHLTGCLPSIQHGGPILPQTLHFLASEILYSLSSLQRLEHWQLGIGLFSSLSSVYS